eukprot:TRINITY_DN62923_c0_g1_i1.p1 TRINITY_DN62923_c0_g1~~TRINITY_DN62923_c0_g1_i1.p1  ORF type:complete len:818 (+),score=90.99 TRINITY_DN62923_c0_g1_i1:124-2454(+)
MHSSMSNVDANALRSDRECWVLFEIGKHNELYLRVGTPGDLEAGHHTHYKVPDDTAEVILEHLDGPSQRVARQPYRELLAKQLGMINELRWTHEGSINVHTLQDEIKVLKRELSQVRNQHTYLEPQLQLEKDRTMKLLEHNTELEKELTLSHVQRERLEDEHHRRLIKLEHELRTVRLENESLQQENGAIPKQLVAERERAEAQLVKVRNQLEYRAFEAQAKSSTLEHQLEQKQFELDKLRKELQWAQEEANQRVETTRRMYQSQQEKDARTMKVQAHEIVNIKQKVADQERSLQEQNKEWQHDISEEKYELKRVKRELEQTNARLHAEVEQRSQAQNQVTETMRNLQNSRQHGSDLQAKIDEQAKDLSALRVAMSKVQHQLAQSEEQVESLREWQANHKSQRASVSPSMQSERQSPVVPVPLPPPTSALSADIDYVPNLPIVIKEGEDGSQSPIIVYEEVNAPLAPIDELPITVEASLPTTQGGEVYSAGRSSRGPSEDGGPTTATGSRPTSRATTPERSRSSSPAYQTPPMSIQGTPPPAVYDIRTSTSVGDSPLSTPWCEDGRATSSSPVISQPDYASSTTHPSPVAVQQQWTTHTSTGGGPRLVRKEKKEQVVIYPPGTRPPIAASGLGPVEVGMPSPQMGFQQQGIANIVNTAGVQYSPMSMAGGGGPAIIVSPSAAGGASPLQAGSGLRLPSPHHYSPVVAQAPVVITPASDLSLASTAIVEQPSMSSSGGSSGLRPSLPSSTQSYTQQIGNQVLHVFSPNRVAGMQEWY